MRQAAETELQQIREVLEPLFTTHRDPGPIQRGSRGGPRPAVLQTLDPAVLAEGANFMLTPAGRRWPLIDVRLHWTVYEGEVHVVTDLARIEDGIEVRYQMEPVIRDVSEAQLAFAASLEPVRSLGELIVQKSQFEKLDKHGFFKLTNPTARGGLGTLSQAAAATNSRISADRGLMEAAIEEMKLSPGKIKVGAVIANKDGDVLAKGHRTEGGVHAEVAAIENLGIHDGGLTLYTTLEPCVGTGSDCANKIIEADIGTVVIGVYDLNPDVYRQGWRALAEADVELRDFYEDLRQRCVDVNSSSEINYRVKVGPKNHGRFSYKTNDAGGKLTIRFSETDPREIAVGFTQGNVDSVWALATPPDEVALADGATKLSQIDDPSALRGFSHTVRVSKGQICVFRSTQGHVKMRLKKVDQASSSVTYEFEVDTSSTAKS